MQRQASQFPGRLVFRHRGSGILGTTLGILTVIVLASLASAQPPQAPPEKGTDPDIDQDYRVEAERLVGSIEMEALVNDQWVEVKQIPKPLLYYTDATRGHTRGSIWAWGETGRPVALLELWQNRS